MNKYRKIGIFIRELRIAQGISQNDLAKLLNISRKAISRWENGRGLPDISLLLPLSEKLGVTVDEILRAELHEKKIESSRSTEEIREFNERIHNLINKDDLVLNSFNFFLLSALLIINRLVSDIGKSGVLDSFGVGITDTAVYEIFTEALLVVITFALIVSFVKTIVCINTMRRTKK